MIRLLTAAALAAVIAAAPQSPGPPLRLEVVATGEDGGPVAGLEATDLDIRIGSYRLPVESLRPVRAATEEAGRYLVLVLDDVTLAPDAAPRVREIARRLIERMAPGDVMEIVTLNGRGTEPTAERARLIAQVNAYSGLSTGIETIDRIGRNYLTLLAQLADRLPEGTRHPVVVGIGAGWLFDTPIPPPSVAASVREEWSAAMRALARAHATLYVVDPGGLGAQRTVDGGESGFARDTGGLAFVNTNDFAGAVDRIMRDAGDYYEVLVGDPPVGRMADLRKLEVRSLKRGVTVRARRWLVGRPGA